MSRGNAAPPSSLHWDPGSTPLAVKWRPAELPILHFYLANFCHLHPYCLQMHLYT